MSLYAQNNLLGILGGGQLGRLLIPSALDLGISLKFMDKDGSVCQASTPNFRIGSLQKKDDILDFAKDCKIISVEIESINCEALQEIEYQGKIVRPSSKILEIVQDKLIQKEYFLKNNFPTAPFYKISEYFNLEFYKDKLPLIVKLRKSGFDGRGVFQIQNLNELENLNDLHYIEDKIHFTKEIAVMVVRNSKGQILSYPCVEMDFHSEKYILQTIFSPARIPPKISKKAKEIAEELARNLNLIGLLAVEFFLTSDDEIIINEISPRPHNSAHHTIDQFSHSQFDLMLRALFDLPLPDISSNKKYSSMINIFCAKENETVSKNSAFYFKIFEELLSIPNLFIHWYNKNKIVPFRKLGHITLLSDTIPYLENKTKWIQEKLNI